VAAIKKKVTKIHKPKKPSPKKVEKKTVKAHASASPAKSAEKLVPIDRRKNLERRGKSGMPPVDRAPLERRAKVNRRRQIDPTTCERDYTLEEIEFMRALDDYKRANGRMFPTCSEVLEVIHKLGYERRPAPAPVAFVEIPVVESPSTAAAV
jgi:hypothetical protein